MSKRNTSEFLSNAKGSVAIVFGLVIPSLIGFTGLGVDAAYWMVQRNKLQAATDSAAVSVAQAVQLDGANAAMTAEAAKLFTKIYGAQLSTVRYQVEYPPTTGPSAGDTSTVAVLAEKDQPIFFLAAFGVEDVVVRTRAVARIDSVAEACLLALSDNDNRALEVTGNATINLGCGVASNSPTTESVYLSGSSILNTTGVSAVGDVITKNNAQVNTNGGPVKSHSAALVDPYGPQGRNLQVPSFPTACAANNLKVKKNTTLAPGRYCGGIDFQGGAVTLSPGVYIMDAGDFKANGNGSITGTDVTIILTGGAGCNASAQLNANGNTSLSLHAPKTGGAMNGVLFFQDPDAPSGTNAKHVLNGNATMNLSGAIYIPKQRVEFSGGTSSNMSCLQVVADTVKLTGNSKITNKCDNASGTERIARTSIKLTE